jgi:putative ABC transport system permease protein
MFFSALSLAWREIRHNPMRSGLTTLGIIIGVAAVIILVTLGKGATARVTSDISALGNNLLFVAPGAQQNRGPPQAAKPFDMADVEALKRDVRGIAAISPSAVQSVSAVYGNKSHTTQVQGGDNSFFTTRNYDLAAGRTFLPAELRAGKPVCILGDTVKTELFGGQTPLGAKIRLGKVACDVIGVLADKGGSTLGNDQDDIIVAPIRMVQRRLAGNKNVNMIFITTQSAADLEPVKKEIQRVMRERRDIRQGEDDDFQVRDMKEITNLIGSTLGVLTAFLAAIAAVSLIVGGIGIMNIMLVSVTERTREIGIRLAIGALARDVLQQFLFEATVLATLGGALGVALGVGGSFLLTSRMNLPFHISLEIIAIAFSVSAAIGVVFGFVPARKAAHFHPIDALRHE